MIRVTRTLQTGERRTYEYPHLQVNAGRALRQCREAVRRAPLHRVGERWRYARRLYNAVTVNALIAAGEAVRIGDVVVRRRLA